MAMEVPVVAVVEEVPVMDNGSMAMDKEAVIRDNQVAVVNKVLAMDKEVVEVNKEAVAMGKKVVAAKKVIATDKMDMVVVVDKEVLAMDKVVGYGQGGRGWGRGPQHDDDHPHSLRDPYKCYVSDGPDYTKHVHTKQAHKDLGDADHYEKDPRRGNDDDGEWHPKEQPTVYPASVKMPPLNPPDKGYSFNIRNLSVFKEQGPALNVGPSEAGYTMDQQHHWQDH
ncbi:hypothetical protein MMC22_002077 [Lobaria immixta]|nr:hypothetical protein [Lobaria immixta]